LGGKKIEEKNSSIYLYDEWASEEKNSSHFLPKCGDWDMTLIAVLWF
jgi:hypothetical protein